MFASNCALAKLLERPASECEEAGYLHTATEIASQPELWIATAQALVGEFEPISALLSPRPRLLLAGAGSSHYVGLSVAPLLSRVFPCVEVVPSTEIVLDPESCLPREEFVLVSFARSGDSPEGNAAVGLAEQLRPGLVRHLAVTCNPAGGLARLVGALAGRSRVLILPEAANDQGLAMTASFTSMAVAGLSLAFAVRAAGKDFLELVRSLAEVGESVIGRFSDLAASLAHGGFHRAFFVASRPFFGGALEAHLKVQELTAGRIMAKAEDTLGIRHGFMAAIDSQTLIVLYLSSDPYRRRFELDLAREIRAKGLGAKTIAFVDSGDGLEGLFDVVFQTGAGPGFDDTARSVLAVLPGQLLGLFASLAQGLRPDAPSPSGVIHRVVQGVEIHPWTDNPILSLRGSVRDRPK